MKIIMRIYLPPEDVEQEVVDPWVARSIQQAGTEILAISKDMARVMEIM